MRVAVSSTGPSKDAPVEQRFGRCACFVVFDQNGREVVATIANDGVNAAEGAGIKTTGLLLRNKVDVVLTGRVGPKAMQALLAGGVMVYTGVEGTVGQTMDKYRQGLLNPLGVPNAHSHAGKKPPELPVS